MLITVCASLGALTGMMLNHNQSLPWLFITPTLVLARSAYNHNHNASTDDGPVLCQFIPSTWTMNIDWSLPVGTTQATTKTDLAAQGCCCCDSALLHIATATILQPVQRHTAC